MKRATLLLGLALATTGCGGAEPERPKNVLLIVVDTLRADRLSCYGYTRETSPYIDELLAGRGVTYEANYSQGCWTVPSMVSMFSGLWVTDNETALSTRHTTLPEDLQKAGFLTAAFVGNPVLRNDRGFDRGFDTFQAPDWDGNATTLAQAFERWYRGTESERADARGWFAWVHPVDPHHPYHPAQEYWKFRDRRPDEELLKPRWQQELHRVSELAPGGQHPPPGAALNEMNTLSNAYDNEVLAADDGVRRMLELLRESGELDQTLVIFASDHGEMLFEHPQYPLELSLKAEKGMENGARDLFMLGHRAWFHEELWNTPLLIAGPGMPAGEVRDGLAANLDIYPTILDALGLPVESEVHGQSLWGGRTPERDAVFGYGFQTAAVLEDSGKKLVEHNRRRFLQEGPGPLPLELFDHTEDATEVTELAEARPDEARRLQARLESWREEFARDITRGTSTTDWQVLDDLGYGGYGDLPGEDDADPEDDLDGPPESLGAGGDG